MKKQYTVKYSTHDYVLITFYEDGVETDSAYIYDWLINTYLLEKHEEGWERAYSKEQYEVNERDIQKLLNNLQKKQELREKMKNNLIG